MHTFNKVRKVLPIAILCLGLLHRESKAQWTTDGSGLYKTEQERFRVLDQALKVLEKSNPLADLRVAIQNKDYRFVGYNGYSFIAPEVPKDLLVYMVTHGIGFKVLSGSNDVANAETGGRQQVIIQKYMKPYNVALLSYFYKNNSTVRKLVDESKTKPKKSSHGRTPKKR